MRNAAAADEGRQVAGDLRERVPSGRQLMMAETTVGLRNSPVPQQLCGKSSSCLSFI